MIDYLKKHSLLKDAEILSGSNIYKTTWLIILSEKGGAKISEGLVEGRNGELLHKITITSTDEQYSEKIAEIAHACITEKVFHNYIPRSKPTRRSRSKSPNRHNNRPRASSRKFRKTTSRRR